MPCINHSSHTNNNNTTLEAAVGDKYPLQVGEKNGCILPSGEQVE